MRKKILFCATIDNHFKGFHLPYMKWFQEQGWEVHIASKGNMKLPYCDKKYNLQIERSPFNPKNIKAYQELKKIIESGEYGIIHCHTPMGGVLTRLAARNTRKNGTKVLYTAHGFHFCKGAPIINWFIYYPLERWLSHYTDCLITINNEDYNLAVKHRFKASKIEHVHGVGVDIERFRPVNEDEKIKLREKHGYTKEDFLLYYAAELNKNKNQGFLIQSMPRIKEQIPKVRLLLVGDGNLFDYYKAMARKINVDNIIDFLGYREDIDEIAKMSDIAVASSLREGLPVNIMEAMACGKPVVAIDNRGHRELIVEGINGWIISKELVQLMAERIVNLEKSSNLINSMGKNTREYILNTFCIDRVMMEMTDLYFKFMGEENGTFN